MATKKKKAAKKAAPAKKKPAAKKKAPAKRAAPARKKAAPARKKAAPARKKAAPARKKAAPARKKAAPAEKKAMARRDGAGHLDARYAADLRKRSKASAVKDDNRAFLRGKRTDALAEELGKEFVETVTSGEDEGTELRDGFHSEEIGGPFLSTRAGQEFAYEPDASNPKRSRREPFPTA